VTDSVGMWLDAAGRLPLLTPSEELHLGAMVREWQDWPGGPDAAPAPVRRRGQRSRDRMIQANLRLVVNVAKRYHRAIERRRLAQEDALQEGSLGLMRGAELFDPSKGYKFSTYGYWWIRQAITRWLSSSDLIRVPVHLRERLNRGDDPTGDERLTAAAAVLNPCSLDRLVGDGLSPLADMLAADCPDPLEGLDAAELVGRMREALQDDLAFVELAQVHKSPELAALLDVSRATVPGRLAASRARLREVA
jgi:RNA polymerase sigma factor (sigma-70 family)